MGNPDIKLLNLPHETNEYGIDFIKYFRMPDRPLIDQYVQEYNISTHMPNGVPIHSMCMNCQILQIEKYKGSDEWAIKTDVLLKEQNSIDSKSTATLQKGQLIKLLEKREDDWCRVRATTVKGVCIEHPEEHPPVYSGDRGLLEEGHCDICESPFSIVTQKDEGWVKFESLTYFKCPCKFVPNEYKLPAKFTKTLPKEKQEELLTLLDPVRWIRKTIGLEPRENQKVNLMCTSKNIVLLEGRRAGKSWGECMALLYTALTTEIPEGIDSEGNPVHRGAEILILTPFLSQIVLLFGILEKLIKRNKAIKLTRFVKTPFYKMEFSNGAKIQGFTTGDNSKSEASVVLGQSGDFILLDEVDRMDTASIVKAIRPIQITTPDVRMMVSSTPTGKREWFYDRNITDSRFKQFFYPSTVIPHWETVKKEAEAEGTHEYFMQEYMAQFTAQVTGVFQPNFVAMAESSYEYNQVEPFHFGEMQFALSKTHPDWIYTLGIDWNKNAGTEIITVGLDPLINHWWVVDSLNIQKQDWQQIKAMEAVLLMNAKWRPKYIYADVGYGHQAIELLQKHALDIARKNPQDPAALMVQSLYAYDFGSKQQYRDPVDGQIKKTDAKAFLVENAVRRFEEARIHFPANDPFLTKQLLNYIIERYTPTGLPKYGMNSTQIGDHRLDALMLALVPFRLHQSDFAVDTPGVTSIGYGKSFGHGNIKTKTVDGDQVFEEFMATLPRNQHGAPMVPGQVLRVRHQAERADELRARAAEHNDFSRTAKLNRDNPNDVPDLKLGWSSDTEWKEERKYAKARVIRRSHNRPGRRSF